MYRSSFNLIGLMLSLTMVVFLSSCSKTFQCNCEGNEVGVKGKWEENEIGYPTAKKGCEINEACTWVEVK